MLENSYARKPAFSLDALPDLTGKVYVISGGLAGIGLETTKILVAKGAKVYSFSRNAQRSEAVIADIKANALGAQVEFIQVDFADPSTIRPAVEQFLKKETELHGIIHNSGIVPQENTTPEDVLQINVYGPHLFQKYLDDIIISTARKYPEQRDQFRILWVSSYMHNLSLVSGGIDWDHLVKHTPLTKRESIADTIVYSHSKVLTIYQSILWNLKHPNSGVISVSLHPGLINSDIHAPGAKKVMNYIAHPVFDGARVEIYAALSPDITAAKAGCHVIPWGKIGRVRPDVEKGANGPDGERLWDFIEEKVASNFSK